MKKKSYQHDFTLNKRERESEREIKLIKSQTTNKNYINSMYFK